MENGNLNAQMPTPIESGSTPPTVPSIPQTPPVDSSSKKPILWFVLGLIVTILLVAGVYLFLSKQQSTITQQPVVTPVPAAQKSLEDDLNSINVESGLDSDFSSIDQDITSL